MSHVQRSFVGSRKMRSETCGRPSARLLGGGSLDEVFVCLFDVVRCCSLCVLRVIVTWWCCRYFVCTVVLPIMEVINSDVYTQME